MKALQSIRIRLLLFAAIGTIVAVAVASAGLVALFGRHVERRVEQELDSQIATIAGNLRIEPGGALAVAREPSDPRFRRPFGGLYWQVLDEKSGKLLGLVGDSSRWRWQRPDKQHRPRRAAGSSGYRTLMLRRSRVQAGTRSTRVRKFWANRHAHSNGVRPHGVKRGSSYKESPMRAAPQAVETAAENPRSFAIPTCAAV